MAKGDFPYSRKWVENHYDVIQGIEIINYKGNGSRDLWDLDERGLCAAFCEPLYLNSASDMQIYAKMLERLQSVKRAYIVTMQRGKNDAQHLVIWVENRAIRCKLCGGFLDGLPPKFTDSMTHQMIGKSCLD